MKHPLEILGNLLLIASGIMFTYQFGTIWLLGWYGREPNPAILAAEILMGLAIAFLGVNRLIDDMRKWK